MKNIIYISMKWEPFIKYNHILADTNLSPQLIQTALLPEDNFSEQNNQGFLSKYVTSCCIWSYSGTSEENMGTGEAKILQQGHIFVSDRLDMNLFFICNDDSLLKEMKFHLWVIPDICYHGGLYHILPPSLL